MVTPRLLDLFSGAGGSARGYQLAGFHVTGVDINPQPHYIGDEFHQADAMTYPLDGYDVIHASPPCQAYARVTGWRGVPSDHPDLLEPVRAALTAWGGLWVIENVPEAPIRHDLLLCGSQFGLSVRRHRAFELSRHTFELMPPCSHHSRLLPFMHKGERAYADAMGCNWMTKHEARQAIPPAYTTFVGAQLLDQLTAVA